VMPAAFLAAILFGLHPIHVESVAWVTERRDVLCGLFYLLCLMSYLDYAIDHGRETRRRAYGTCIFWFTASLLAKPMAVTLPLVFMLLDAWPLGRFSMGIRSLGLEKAAFLILSALAACLTWITVGQYGAIQNLQSIPLDARFLNAIHSFGFYLWKLAFPTDLAALYPLAAVGSGVRLGDLGAAVLFFGLAGLSLAQFRRWPFVPVAALYYLITLLPVSGLFQAGSQAAADRYAYLPSLGPLWLFSSLVAHSLSRNRWTLWTLIGLSALFLGWRTIVQERTWVSSVALWENVERVSPDSSVVAEVKLGNAYQEAGRLGDSLIAYDRAIRLVPSQSVPHDWKGSALLTLGRDAEAEQEFLTAVRLDPKDPLSHCNLSLAYQKTGHFQEALREAQEAVSIDPHSSLGYNDLGVAEWGLKNTDQALQAYQQAVSLDPGDVNARLNLGDLLLEKGRGAEAAEQYERGISENPREAEFYGNLAYVYFQRGDYPQAVDLLRKALGLQPRNPALYQKLGMTYEKLGRQDLASECFNQARTLSNADPQR